MKSYNEKALTAYFVFVPSATLYQILPLWCVLLLAAAVLLLLYTPTSTRYPLGARYEVVDVVHDTAATLVQTAVKPSGTAVPGRY